MAENNSQKPGLTDQIAELETLVDKKSIQSRVNVIGDQVIPILDELVTRDNKVDNVELNEHNENDEQRYHQLVERVEEKLSQELDEIVSLLKGSLKESILHELQDQIKKDPDSDSSD